jgi:hypothetical protein
MNSTAQILLFAVLVIPWVVVILFILTKKQRARKYFRKLQEKYSLTGESNWKKEPVVYGFYRNRAIRVENAEAGRDKKLSTLLSVECDNPENFEFSLVKRNKMTARDGIYLVDDKEFDDKFVVNTNNPEMLRRLFDFNTRFKLQQVSGLGYNGEIKLEGNRFTYTQPGVLSNDVSLMKLELVLHEICDLADVMKYN